MCIARALHLHEFMWNLFYFSNLVDDMVSDIVTPPSSPPRHFFQMKFGRFVLQKATLCWSRSRRAVERQNSLSLPALKGMGNVSLLEPKVWSSSRTDSLAKGLWCEGSPGPELGHDYGELDADESDTAPSLVKRQLRSLQRQQVQSQRQLEECQRQLKECQQQLLQSQRQQSLSQRQQVESQRQLEECQRQLLDFQQLMRKLASGSFQNSSS